MLELVSGCADIVGARRCGRVGCLEFYGTRMPSEPQEFTAGLPRKRMAAGLLITDSQDRFLLVEPAYKTDWRFPEAVLRPASRRGRRRCESAAKSSA
ncbi:NUDIX hydrolase [Micromonospora parastrephiae]|uniref:hypothetical protein n=1 Tax=Micromonospora parastrephiae TaxID=2806101 RepID=UPI001EE49761|nr:hypothetical protein [Micromonospora parastrephiae]